MKPLRFSRSFRFRLLAASLLVEGLMLALLVGNSLRLIQEHLVRQTEQRIAAIELAYRTAVAIPLASRDYATLRDILDGWRQADDVRYLAVTDPGGKILASSGWDTAQVLPVASSKIEPGSTMHVMVPINYLGQSYGTVHYGLSLDFLTAARRDLFVQGSLIALGEIALSLILLSVLGYWLTRRLVKLGEASERIAHGDYQTPVSISGNDEIARLAGNFNLMSEAISTRINALHETKEALRVAKNTAEQANIAKSQFLANMSHELRTPLNAVIGMAQLLKMTNLTDEQREYVQTIMGGGNNLLAVVNDILDVSQLETGSIQLRPSLFSPAGQLLGLQRRFAPQADAKGIELATRIASPIPDVIGDAERFSQILGNLLSNAIKFTSHGKVELLLSYREAEDATPWLTIIVSDTGIGMTEAVIQQLFSPFFQADSSSTRQHGGTGLGLALCKRLVDLMNGTISVNAKPGQGSTFTVQLPFAKHSCVH